MINKLFLLILLTLFLNANAQKDSSLVLGRLINSYDIATLYYDSTKQILINPVWGKRVNTEGLKKCIIGLNETNDTIYHFGHPPPFSKSIELYFKKTFNINYHFSGDLIHWQKVCSTEKHKQHLKLNEIDIDSLRIKYNNLITKNLPQIKSLYNLILKDSCIQSNVKNLRLKKSGFSIKLQIKGDRIKILNCTLWKGNDLTYFKNKKTNNKSLNELINRIKKLKFNEKFEEPIFWQLTDLDL